MDDLAEMEVRDDVATRLRVRGIVQGVGFRPAVWRLAQRYGIRGSVANDGQGVTIHACGAAEALERFVAALTDEPPPLALIECVERESAAALSPDAGFRIADSVADAISTGVASDAAPCADCVAEIVDRESRRFRYPFTNCTHCGPRLSIVERIPYDRAATTMRRFAMCDRCRAEYDDPADRRFHAQPIACPDCGPRVWLERSGAALPIESLAGRDAARAIADPIDAAAALLERGHIVAIKGLGGFQLACDATNEVAVSRLRSTKRRERKPFAMMARDLDVVRRYCSVAMDEAALLAGAAAPIVVLARHQGSQPWRSPASQSQAPRSAEPRSPELEGPSRSSAFADGTDIAPSVAPGIATLGFMLPSTPLHHLLMLQLARPIVLTSGNLSDEPQCIDNSDARARLSGIAGYFLMHDRDIARRVDDSVVRVSAGSPRVVRRARGYAPVPLALPSGFSSALPVLAMGAQLKNGFCLLRNGTAVLSHHIGDLDDARTLADYRRSVDAYLDLFAHTPAAIAADLHPDYASTRLGFDAAERRGIDVIRVQHHHAHFAACLAENGVALDASPVLGVTLDGLGLGDDGTWWGGEFLLGGYRECTRVGSLMPVAMPGGDRCSHEPWRNAYAHLRAAWGWSRVTKQYPRLDLVQFLNRKPLAWLDRMIDAGVNAPHASSCGRLFDAVAAAVGICREQALYEGQAAIELEALLDSDAIEHDDAHAYPFSIGEPAANGLRVLDPAPMWAALLDDLARGVAAATIAARFHQGLAIGLARMIEAVQRPSNRRGDSQPARPAVALSGGVFQNRILLEHTAVRLEDAGFDVLAHRNVPPNDGGLALGQATIAAATLLAGK